jgi:hypothetical protein
VRNNIPPFFCCHVFCMGSARITCLGQMLPCLYGGTTVFGGKGMRTGDKATNGTPEKCREGNAVSYGAEDERTRREGCRDTEGFHTCQGGPG